MKFFKDENNSVYAFELDGSQDAYIKSNLILVSEKEAGLLRADAEEKLKLNNKDLIYYELINIDKASIRAIREYIVSKQDAPLALKEHEITATILRKQLICQV